MKSFKSKKNKSKVNLFNNLLNFLNNKNEIKKSDSTSFSICEVIIVVFISLMFGVIIGYIIPFTSSPFKSVNSDIKLRELVNTYNGIVESYYKDVDKDKVVDAAIEGMISSLDDSHSNFMSGDIANNFNESVNGSFVGIGVTVIFENDYHTVISVNKNGPAYKAGIKVNDVIVRVNGNDVKGISGDNFSNLIRGEKGSVVNIVVLRNNEEKKVSVSRDIIEINNVTNNILDIDNHKIGYIKINSFSSVSYKQFSKSLKRLEGKKIESLIIDVRYNSGGHLSQVNEILDLFMKKNTVLYKLDTKGKIKNIKSKTTDFRKYPVAVLVNNGSASASEILASSFNENYKNSFIIGTNTYGKGTVQKSQNLLSGSTIKYTTNQWLTSNGSSIDGVGIEPKFVVEQSNDYYINSTFENDLQLQFAIEKLKESN